ncbi:hypothetical protein QE152_g22304 [Popillia japonica]|uniref:DUF7869 domain-containing protein n=1 Tax=Popillia japonica TaxID=7064 RepID=A0AAW1KLJ2_POPJA
MLTVLAQQRHLNDKESNAFAINPATKCCPLHEVVEIGDEITLRNAATEQRIPNGCICYEPGPVHGMCPLHEMDAFNANQVMGELNDDFLDILANIKFDDDNTTIVNISQPADNINVIIRNPLIQSQGMSDKNKKTTFNTTFISLDVKIQILDRLIKGEKASHIAKTQNLNEATVRTINKNEKKIRTAVAQGSSTSAKYAARPHTPVIEKKEKALSIWIDDSGRNRPVIEKKEKALSIWIDDSGRNRIALDGNIIRQKALKIYKHLKENGESSTAESYLLKIYKHLKENGESSTAESYLKKKNLDFNVLLLLDNAPGHPRDKNKHDLITNDEIKSIVDNNSLQLPTEYALDDNFRDRDTNDKLEQPHTWFNCKDREDDKNNVIKKKTDYAMNNLTLGELSLICNMLGMDNNANNKEELIDFLCKKLDDVSVLTEKDVSNANNKEELIDFLCKKLDDVSVLTEKDVSNNDDNGEQNDVNTQQLNYYHFAIVNGSSKGKLDPSHVFSYLWLETDAPKDSNAIASAVHHCLKNFRFTETTKIVRLFADGCGGQNKNVTMMAMLSSWLLQDAPKMIETVEFIFPIVGHSFMPPDRVFGVIEKQLRKKSVIVNPVEYDQIIENYATIRKIQAWNIFDWRTEATRVLKRPAAWHFQFNKMKRFIFNKSSKDNVLLRGEPHYFTDFGMAKGVCKKGNKISFLSPKSPPYGRQLKGDKSSINKLLVTHFGANWQLNSNLELYKKILFAAENVNNELVGAEEPEATANEESCTNAVGSENVNNELVGAEEPEATANEESCTNAVGYDLG